MVNWVPKLLVTRRKGVRRKARIVRARRLRPALRPRQALNVQRWKSRISRAPIITTKVIQNRGRDITVIKHREYLDQVLCPQAATSYVLQPTSTDTFTWLPKVAQCFEMYRLKKFTFHYESTTGTESSGAVHMGFDYDVLDDTEPDEHALSQFTTWLRTGLWKSASMPLNMALANRVPWHFTATHGYPAVSDQKTYDIGRFWVIGAGTGAAVAAGELYMEYEFEFCSPTVEINPLTEVTYPTTPVNNTDHYELAAVAPTVAAIAGQQLMEYIGRNNVTFTTGAGATTKYVDIYRALHGFLGYMIAEGGVPLSAVSRAVHRGTWFNQSETAAGPYTKMLNDHGEADETTQCWRAPNLNYGNSVSDQTAGMLGIGEVCLRKGLYYLFPWVNTSSGAETAWSTPPDIARNLKYYLTATLPHMFSAISLSKPDETCSSSSFTRLVPEPESDEEEDPKLVVKRRK